MVGIVENMASGGHQQLLINNEPHTGLRAFISIHSTALGPALSGVRMYNYLTELEAIKDALKLSQSTSFRASLSGCDFGGASIVLWGNPHKDKNETYFRAVGKIIKSLNGKIIATTEFGTNFQDLMLIGKETEFIAPPAGGSGDISFVTALGVFYSLRVCVKNKFGQNTLSGLTIAIQGVGGVGSNLINIIKKEEKDTKIVISDIDYDKIKAIQDVYPEIKAVEPEEIVNVKCDVFSPCAIGGVIGEENYKALKCRIIAGGSTNVLADENIVTKLHKKGILFAPDFLINAGEVIQIQNELQSLPRERSIELVKELGGVLGNILKEAADENRPPYFVAKRMAETRIKDITSIKYLDYNLSVRRPPPLAGDE